MQSKRGETSVAFGQLFFVLLIFVGASCGRRTKNLDSDYKVCSLTCFMTPEDLRSESSDLRKSSFFDQSTVGSNDERTGV